MVNVLTQAGGIVSKKWKNSGSGWKVVLIIGCVILSVLGIIGLVLWFLGRLVKSLTTGGFRNRDLYMPRMGSRRR